MLPSLWSLSTSILELVLFSQIVLGSTRPAHGEPRQQICLHNACLGAVLNASRVLPSIASVLTASPSALKSLDRTLRKCCRFLLGWPIGSPNVGVLVELGWPDAERIFSGRFQSRFGRVTSMINGPLPVAVFQAASRIPGTWATCVLNMSHSLGTLLPDAFGVMSGSLPSVSRPWFESEVRHLFDDGLHSRAAVALRLCLLSIFPPCIFRWWWPRSHRQGSSSDNTRVGTRQMGP